jgi:hypothetical protein
MTIFVVFVQRELDGSHQILVDAAGVNILGGIVHTIKENTEALIAANT